VVIMGHWIGRAGARGGIYARSAAASRGGGECMGEGTEGWAGELRYAAINSPPTLAARQRRRERERRKTKEERAEPAGCCLLGWAAGAVGMR
jgi:hypothetical protein